MRLTVQRQPAVEGVVFGTLFVDGRRACDTLEGADTLIPRGTYDVTMTPSSRFGRLLPILHDVPGRSGIRLHPGNSAHDTSGCILVGTANGSRLVHSRLALAELQHEMAERLALGEPVTITIREGDGPRAA